MMTDLELIYNKLWNLRCILSDIEGGVFRASKETLKDIQTARMIVDDLTDYCEEMMDEGSKEVKE